MTKNAAEEADRDDGSGGRVIARGTVSIGGASEPSEESAAGSSVFGDVEARTPEPWWSKDDSTQAVDPTETRSAPSRPKAEPPGPVLHYVPPTTAEDVHEIEIAKHGRIAVVLVHELKLSNEVAGRVASRLMSELYAVDMKANPYYRGT